MTLKAFYDKKEDIPEALVSEYVEKDGKWVLDAEGMVASEELSTMKTRLDEFRTNNVELAAKLKKFEGKKILSPEEQEEFARLIQQAHDIEDKKLIDAGKIDELLSNRTEKMRDDYENKLTSMQKTLDEATELSSTNAGRLSKVMISSEVSQLLSDQGLNPVKGAMEDIFARAGKVWKVNKEGSLTALNAKGDPMYGKGTEALTLVEWGQQLAKDAPYLFVDSKGSDGKGGAKPPVKGDDGILRIPKTNEELKSKHIDDIASGKAIVVDE